MHISTLLAAIASIGIFSCSELSAARVLYSRPAPPNAQLALQIAGSMNNTNNVIPGGSPFFYMDDPSKNLFAISSIFMTPTPCQIGLPCSIQANGFFRDDLTSIQLDFDVDARLPDGQAARIIAVKDNLCGWATMAQGERSDCPPRRGSATISASLDLARGWVMEATYMIDLKLTSKDRLLTHVGAKITLSDLGTHTISPNAATA